MPNVQNYKKLFTKLRSECNATLGIWIDQTKQIDVKTTAERSVMISRLESLCKDDDEKKVNPAKEYHLCKLVQHSMRSLSALPDAKPDEQKAKIAKITRTRSLLSDVCPISLEPLVYIMKNDKDDDPAQSPLEKEPLDLRKVSLTRSLTTRYLDYYIKENFKTNTANQVFFSFSISPLESAPIVSINETMDLVAIERYVKLCHLLEEQPLLLNLSADYLCVDREWDEQIDFISEKVGDFLTRVNIQLLNMFGYAELIKPDGGKAFKQFCERIKTISHYEQLVLCYGDLLSVEHIEKNAQTLFDAIADLAKNDKLQYHDSIYLEALFQANRPVSVNVDQLITEMQISCDSLKNTFPVLLHYDHFDDQAWVQILKQLEKSSENHRIAVGYYVSHRIKKFGSAEQWLLSAIPDLQLALFDLVESQHFALDYLTLYMVSDQLRESPRIQQVYHEHKLTALEQLSVRYVFSERDEKQITTYKQLLKSTPNLNFDLVNLQKIKQDLAEYRNNYLTITDNRITTSFFTPKERADAYQAIIPILENKPIDLDQLHAVLIDPVFQKNVGEHSFRTIRPLSLLQPLIQVAKQREEHIRQRQQILRHVENNDVLLLELLLDFDVLKSLSAAEFQILFDCGNKGLFAEILIRVHPDFKIQFVWQGMQITSEFLKHIVPLSESTIAIDHVNKMRYQYRIPHYIPIGVKYPGVTPGDAALDKAALYQLQDSDITVGEEILSEKFSAILPSVSIMEVMHSKNIQLVPKARDKKSGDTVLHDPLSRMHLIPMSLTLPVLIDPDLKKHKHRRTYQTFKENIRLIAQALSTQGGGVACGILNLNANHYVPYFIYCDALQNVSILTVDPSYETSPLLKKCFIDIFPKCHYQDAGVVQQVRQRDCGFNSLQVLDDALASLGRKPSLLTIEDGVIRYDLQCLTINGANYKCYDYAQKKDFFLKPFIQQLESVRLQWAELLKTKNKVSYNQEVSLDYSYADNVDHQEEKDSFDERLSMITALMLDDGGCLELFREQYKNKLLLPSIRQLKVLKSELVKKDGVTREVAALLEGESGAELLYTLCKLNFKSDTATGLINFFIQGFLPYYSLNKDCTVESIYRSFTETEKFVEFSKLLSERDLHTVREQVIDAASKYRVNELLRLKQQSVQQYLCDNIQAMLKTVPEPRQHVQAIVALLQESAALKSDMDLLIRYPEAWGQLLQFIHDQVDLHAKVTWQNSMQQITFSDLSDAKHNIEALVTSKGLSLIGGLKYYQAQFNETMNDWIFLQREYIFLTRILVHCKESELFSPVIIEIISSKLLERHQRLLRSAPTQEVLARYKKYNANLYQDIARWLYESGFYQPGSIVMNTYTADARRLLCQLLKLPYPRSQYDSLDIDMEIGRLSRSSAFFQKIGQHGGPALPEHKMSYSERYRI